MGNGQIEQVRAQVERLLPEYDRPRLRPRVVEGILGQEEDDLAPTPKPSAPSAGISAARRTSLASWSASLRRRRPNQPRPSSRRPAGLSMPDGSAGACPRCDDSPPSAKTPSPSASVHVSGGLATVRVSAPPPGRPSSQLLPDHALNHVPHRHSISGPSDHLATPLLPTSSACPRRASSCTLTGLERRTRNLTRRGNGHG